MPITKVLTLKERELAAEVAAKIREMCELACDHGHPFAAAQLARHGQVFARLAYRRGMGGWSLFDKYFR